MRLPNAEYGELKGISLCLANESNLGSFIGFDVLESIAVMVCCHSVFPFQTFATASLPFAQGL
jgi:hypothetical protein